MDPEVLLMDEPTNYLDVEGLAWLESWFQKFRGALLLVSHDRHFMNRVCTHIVDVDRKRITAYAGPPPAGTAASSRASRSRNGATSCAILR